MWNLQASEMRLSRHLYRHKTRRPTHRGTLSTCAAWALGTVSWCGTVRGPSCCVQALPACELLNSRLQPKHSHAPFLHNGELQLLEQVCLLLQHVSALPRHTRCVYTGRGHLGTSTGHPPVNRGDTHTHTHASAHAHNHIHAHLCTRSCTHQLCAHANHLRPLFNMLQASL